MANTWPASVESERLIVRAPIETDRARMVELWTTPSFMVFTGGAKSLDEANQRFDRMLARVDEIPFAKQPVVERATGLIVGYTGVDFLDFEGDTRMEWGYRLVESARNQGYATEASAALLEAADDHVAGGAEHPDQVFAIIDSANSASKNVAAKLGFKYWKPSIIDGDAVGLHRRRLGRRSR